MDITPKQQLYNISNLDITPKRQPSYISKLYITPKQQLYNIKQNRTDVNSYDLNTYGLSSKYLQYTCTYTPKQQLFYISQMNFTPKNNNFIINHS